LQEALSYLTKAVDYSLKEQKLEYLIHLCEFHAAAKNEEGLKAALKKYKETDSVYYAIVSSYYQQPFDESYI
jgi:hypothetical protein